MRYRLSQLIKFERIQLMSYFHGYASTTGRSYVKFRFTTAKAWESQTQFI